MTARTTRWETDPLLSAAEVVQDSADRMESFYRLLAHELDTVHRDDPLSNIPSSTLFHRCNLITALETTKWQLEDFERAVRAVSDETGSRERALQGHNQFIEAIRAHVLDVHKYLDEISSRVAMRNTQTTFSNEQDDDRLESFLSGSSPGKSMTKSSFHSTVAVEEIIELKPEETCLDVDDTSDLNCRWKLDSAYMQNGCNRAIGDKGIDQRKLFYFGGFINRFWHAKKYCHSKTFTKKRKDGEIIDNTADMSSCPGPCMGSGMCSPYEVGNSIISNFWRLQTTINFGVSIDVLSRLGIFSRCKDKLWLPMITLAVVILTGVVGFLWLFS